MFKSTMSDSEARTFRQRAIDHMLNFKTDVVGLTTPSWTGLFLDLPSMTLGRPDVITGYWREPKDVAKTPPDVEIRVNAQAPQRIQRDDLTSASNQGPTIVLQDVARFVEIEARLTNDGSYVAEFEMGELYVRVLARATVMPIDRLVIERNIDRKPLVDAWKELLPLGRG